LTEMDLGRTLGLIWPHTSESRRRAPQIGSE